MGDVRSRPLVSEGRRSWCLRTNNSFCLESFSALQNIGSKPWLESPRHR